MGEWHGDTDYPDYPYSEKQAAINDVGEVVEGLYFALRDQALMKATPIDSLEQLARELREAARRHGVYKPID